MAVIEKQVATTADIQDGQMKELPFGEGGTILLTKVNGQLSATSHKCTHYGAPLVKGVLSSDGRIVCPWHGACFNSATGDIEEAPALDSLCKYEVEVRDDKIFVKADEGAVQILRRKPTVSRPLKALATQTVVIVGGGAGGATAAEALREYGFDGRILIVSRETYLPIDRIKLSKSFDIGDPSKIALRDAPFYESLGIEFNLGTDVIQVDTSTKKITLSNADVLNYDKLILSVGGVPRSIATAGADLANIFTLRSWQDSHAIAGAISKVTGRPKLVIIGSSFIGMEMASAASKNADITVIGSEKCPFERSLGETIGKVLQELHEQNGIQFLFNAGIDYFEPKVHDPKSVGYVVLKSGEKLSVDVLVLAVGVTPATDFLKDSPGFQLEKDGSLKVDKHMQVIGLSDVYAAGDIARFPYQYDSENPDVRIEHWDVAGNTGRVIATNVAAGLPIKAFDIVPFFWTSQFGKNLRYCGFGAGYDDVVFQGNVNEFSFVAFYVRGEKVLAVASVGRDPVVSHATRLIRFGKMPPTSEIRNGQNILDIQA